MQIDRVGAHQYSTLTVGDDNYEGVITFLVIESDRTRMRNLDTRERERLGE